MSKRSAAIIFTLLFMLVAIFTTAAVAQSEQKMVVNGYVYEINCNPVQGCLIWFYDEDWKVVDYVITESSGYFEIELPAGSYYMKTDPHESFGLVDEYYNNTLSTENAYLISSENEDDFYFDEQDGKFHLYEPLKVYLAYEADPPQAKIFQPLNGQFLKTRNFPATFIVSDESLKFAKIELFNSANELVDTHYECFVCCNSNNGAPLHRNLIPAPWTTPRYQIHNGTTSTVSFSVFEDDNYRLVLTAEDETGNVTTDTVEFVVDSTPPQISIEGVTDGAWYNYTVTPTVNFDDINLETTSVSLTKDGTAVAEWASGVPVSEEGHYVLLAKATDKAGNETTAQVEFYIDLTPPTIDFVGFENGAWYNHDVTPCVVFTDNMKLETTEAAVNETEPICVVYSEEGTYTVSALAVDKAGNETTAIACFYIDRTAPEVTITAPINGSAHTGNVNVDADYSPDVVSIEVYVDNQMIGTTVPITFDSSVLSDGEHTVTVTVYDRAGNTGSDSVVFISDNNPPVITCDIIDGSYIPTDTVIPEFDIKDATLNNVYAWVNSNYGTRYNFGTPISGEGQYTIHVIADDMFGRVTHFKVTFTLDRTPPSISITGVEDGTTYTAPVTPEFSAEDANLATVSATLNGEPFESGTEITEDGTYTLVVTASDKAGNESSRTVSFTIDRTPPSCRIKWIQPYSTNQSPNRTFYFAWESPGTDAVFFDVEYRPHWSSSWFRLYTNTTKTFTYLTGNEGTTYYLRARAKDSSGNTGDWSEVKYCTIPYDNTSPLFTVQGKYWYYIFNSNRFRANSIVTSARDHVFKNTSSLYGVKEIALIITKRPDGGKADVYINGKLIKTIDTYSPAYKYRVPVVISTYSSPQTIWQIKVLTKGTRNPSSLGTKVEIDGVGIRR